jgi:hypothetical protein
MHMIRHQRLYFHLCPPIYHAKCDRFNAFRVAGKYPHISRAAWTCSGEKYLVNAGSNSILVPFGSLTVPPKIMYPTSSNESIASAPSPDTRARYSLFQFLYAQVLKAAKSWSISCPISVAFGRPGKKYIPSAAVSARNSVAIRPGPESAFKNALWPGKSAKSGHNGRTWVSIQSWKIFLFMLPLGLEAKKGRKCRRVKSPYCA